jgi:hypothetical protein
MILLGRNWLDVLVPKWRDSFRINKIEFCREFLSKLKVDYNEIFKREILEPIKDSCVDIKLTDNAVPIICKPYNVPMSLRDKVEKELDRLEKEGILSKVRETQWASPIVIVPKNDGNIRICGNYAVSVNPYIRTDHYPIPVIDEVLAGIGGKLYYCVIDLKGAYQQLKLSDNARKLLVINTHKGL